MSSDIEERYPRISDVLLEYGSLLSPWTIGGLMDALDKRCEELRASPPTTDAERAAAEHRLDEVLVAHVLNPNVRAFEIHRAMKLPHLGSFSHLLERAVFHYLKGDNLSAILVALPAVEGVLRSYCGWSAAQPALSKVAVRQALVAKRAIATPWRHALYLDRLIAFHERWLWCNTKDADTRLSFLNRHYVAHALGDGNYYRAKDCHRLFLFFDLFTEIVALEQGDDEPFIPMGIPAMERRRIYYSHLAVQRSKHRELFGVPALSLKESIEQEEALLCEHTSYRKEANPVAVEDVVMRFADLMEIK